MKSHDEFAEIEIKHKKTYEIVTGHDAVLDPLVQLEKGFERCDEVLRLLTAALDQNPVSADFSLFVYKELVTSALALKVFCRERYYVLVNRRGATALALQKYYELQLSLLDAFEDRYGFFDGYYRSGMCNLDHLYYLPEPGNSDMVLLPEVALPEGLKLGYATYLFARFKSGEIMREFLNSLIARGVEPSPVVKPTEKKKNLVRTVFNLSVDQLGMGARAALDAALISGKSFQAICEELAGSVSTAEKQVLSAGSIRSNAYTGEDIDKHTLIRYLEKMIRLIREY